MNDFTVVMDFLTRYGMLFLFVIVFLEYLNLPGLPSGIIMPAAGLMVSQTDESFLWALFLSVVAGLLGSWVLYAIGYYCGAPVLDWMYGKFAWSRTSIDKVRGYSDRYGNRSVFITRLIPVARTIISLVGGTTRMSFWTFSLYSVGGITIWNFVYIIAGYFFGNLIFGL